MTSPAAQDSVEELAYRDVLVAYPQAPAALARQYASRQAELIITAAHRPPGWSWAQFDEDCADLDSWLTTQLELN